MKIYYRHNRTHRVFCANILDRSQDLEKEFKALNICDDEWHISGSEGFETNLDLTHYYFLHYISLLELRNAHYNLKLPKEIIGFYMSDVWCHLVHRICNAYVGRFNNISEVKVLELFGGKHYFHYKDYSGYVHVFDYKISVSN